MSTKGEASANEEVVSVPENLEKKTDKHGNEYYAGNCGDFYIPAFRIGDNDFKTHASEIRNLELKDDDILICSMAKAGYHWHSQIINMLIEKSTSYQEKLSRFLDPGVRSITIGESRRVLMTHFPFGAIPKQAIEKKVKIVYLTRNPKDVIVSFYAHMHSHLGFLNYPGKFEHFYHAIMEENIFYGDLFDYLLGYQQGFESHPDLPVLTSNFEDMKEDPVRGVARLNDFLETGCSPDLCSEIAQACDFGALKKVKLDTMPAGLKAVFKPGSGTFYRKGEVGDWKNWFTVTMNEHFDAEYRRRMGGYKTDFRFTLHQ